ncbi:MAG: inorganic phosphate transporter [Salana multivorans]|uniref:inorganic phosphate transporter n=1 Tax=Salana multivorans TaxID=120377 RepID=UPI000B0722CE|nr:inorganic phosphate transporter [Salana multivorans]MBN8883867.1 inorganic phosphate transporter [Salana multivorans]
MDVELIILGLVVVTALAFDFTNGFHDTGNAMATSIATGALKPKTAVAYSAILNLVGAFLSVEVALTVTRNVLNIQTESGALVEGLSPATAIIIIFAGLIGGVLWNVLTWLLGLPSSSSHALFGGLIGSGLAAMGLLGVNWGGVLAKIILPALLAPPIAIAVAFCGTWLVYRLTRSITDTERRNQGFRWGQVGTSGLISLAHGTGDAQKTMGVIALALIAHGSLSVDGIEEGGLPPWIIVVCACAIALGTYLGGWRIIRTLGKGLVEVEAPQGMAAEASSAAIILTSATFGMALSTTHVATGSILGSGLGRKAQVRWSVAGRMAVAWLITLPAAALVGAVSFFIANALPPLAGALTIFAILVAGCLAVWLRSRRQAVNAANVNDEWDAGTAATVETSAGAGLDSARVDGGDEPLDREAAKLLAAELLTRESAAAGSAGSPASSSSTTTAG